MKPQCVTIQMKAIEQYFHLVLFMKLKCVTIQIKAIEHCFQVVLLKVVVVSEPKLCLSV